MTNLKLYSALLSNSVANANSTDQGEVDINEFMEMNIPDVCGLLCGCACNMLGLKEDDDNLDEALGEVTLRQLMEYVYQLT